MGYVGRALAEAFSCHFKVVGFDTNRGWVEKLKFRNSNANLSVFDDPGQIGQADFIVIAVPTPVNKSKEPDLSHVTDAARIVSQNMKAGCTVILESTVYPGVTEEVVKPILEESGLKCGEDFAIGYSPERITAGDDEHAIDRTTKIVAATDEETTESLAELYRRITPHVFKAKDMRTAEAAKVIENIQRDLNIALVNELAIIFDKMGLSTKDVLDAAATKWNFHRYFPGLVGGHCIPVDPYYLVYKAREMGYHPQVILAGRAINDSMPKHIAETTIKALNDVGKAIKGSRVLIMGLTYKEDVADTRNSPAKELIRELQEYGVEILGYDPLLEDIEDEFGIGVVADFDKIAVDGVILTVAHRVFRGITVEKLKGIMKDKPVLIDPRRFFGSQEVMGKGVYYRTL